MGGFLEKLMFKLIVKEEQKAAKGKNQKQKMERRAGEEEKWVALWISLERVRLKSLAGRRGTLCVRSRGRFCRGSWAKLRTLTHSPRRVRRC
jgi:hypothetical protein